MQPIKKFKDIPLKDPSFEDTWYASYDAPEPRCIGHRIYVPKENSLGSLSSAFAAAYKVGETHVGINDWQGFSVVMEIGEAAGQTVGWPYIHLLPIVNT